MPADTAATLIPLLAPAVLGPDLLATVIHPPVAPSRWWWLLALATLALAGAVGWLGRRRYLEVAKEVEAGPDHTVETARARALAAVDDVVARHAAGALTGRLASQEISALVRTFVGTTSDGDADYATAGQLVTAARRDPHLRPVAQFAAAVEDACFAPDAAPDVAGIAGQAREVIGRWH